MLNTQQALEKFGKGVIKQSRTNLTKGKKNVNKQLYNSLKYDLEVGPNSFSITINMEDYGKFQDEGVKGADPSKVSPNAKITGQQAPNSRFRFGSGNYSGTWNTFIDSLQDWVKKRGIRFRKEDGTFAKGSTRTLAHIIAKNIYARGIKPSRFFSRAFETQFENLPDEIVEAFALDLDDLLKFSRE